MRSPCRGGGGVEPGLAAHMDDSKVRGCGARPAAGAGLEPKVAGGAVGWGREPG